MIRQTISPSALVALAFALTACGGKVVVDGVTGEGGAGGQAGVTASSTTASSTTASSTTGGSSVQETTCTKFCAIAAEKGCPSTGDCQARCLAMFVDECEPDLVAALDCAAPLLNVECFLGYPDDAAACANLVTQASTCLSDAAGITCSSLGTTLLDAGACQSQGSCSVGTLAMTCDPQGTCTCSNGGKVVGTCQNLIGGVEFCSVTGGCCAPLFLK